MPDPFRHYEGVPVIDLPADPPSPDVAAWDVLRGRLGPLTALNGPALLSRLLFYSAAISASKLAPATGYRYALRVNPSSGNLHPTEFHFATRGLAGWPDGIYHYRPSQHMAERRGSGDFGFDGTLVFVLTTIAWREAWKYRDRAYRYCLHDIGHAWQALELAARAMGFTCSAVGSFDDAELTKRLGLAHDEWPMLVMTLHGEAAHGALDREFLGGVPNVLSDDSKVSDLIQRMHAATCGLGVEWIVDRPVADVPAVGGRGFGEVVRTRRSALDFAGGERDMTMAQLLAVLSVARAPLLILYLYVHRVAGLPAGLYRYAGELELLRTGDQRVAAAGLSLGQDLAGNACIAISMIADLDGAVSRYGDRGYRYAHFEAGALGHRLYIAAEALGLGATGIGAFFDDRVHSYLDVERGQVIYHFAIGYPIPDPRLEA
ncbi:MAG: SagB/ThcOx family dehydrogenase [Bryobacteraceae bacterium]